MSHALVVPNPRKAPVPAGWAESEVLPIVAEAGWDDLNEYEAQLSAVASYIESIDGDRLEFEKAKRIVEWRRGVLLGVDVTPGERTDLSTLGKVQVSPPAASRFRTIARHWEELVRPYLLAAQHISDVSQAAILRLVRLHRPPEPGAAETCEVKDLHALVERGETFGTIYADPPWRYGNQATRGATGDHYKHGDAGMSTEEICALPVRSLAAESAHLHLWTTNAFLFESRAVMEAWGFEYKSCFVWVKPQMGMGNYWRVSHEFCLVGVRGALPFRVHDEMSWKQWPRGRHSAKPQEMYELIERVSYGPYLELFARKRRDGWKSWGNEIELNLFYQDSA